MAPAATSRWAVALVSLLLVWRIVHVNAVLYEDDGRPRFVRDASPGVGEREILARVLREDPAEAAALVLLAGVHERGRDLALAARAYSTALAIAPLDREVLSAAAEFFIRQGALAEAIPLLDQLAENYAELRPKVFPVLARILVSGREQAAWKALVARNPAWLGPFIAAACAERDIDPSSMLALLMRRAESARALPEAGCVIDRLRAAGRWEEAYHVWLNTLPRERLADVGYVFNGGFEYAPSGYGFDWIAATQAQRNAGHAVEIATTLGAVGKKALRVTYNGKRQDGVPIEQFLALAPGRYELSAMVRADSLKSVRGARWTVRCADGGKPTGPLGASERFLGSSEWRRFAFDVVVPATCRGQVLQLEPVGADEGVTYLAGTLWFDDFVLRKALN